MPARKKTKKKAKKKPAKRSRKKSSAAISKGSAKRVVGRPFKKGQSGNPSGRPKIVAHVRELAREHTADAIATLAEIMNEKLEHPAARVAACKELLDRGYGKSPLSIQPPEGEEANSWLALVKLAMSARDDV